MNPQNGCKCSLLSILIELLTITVKPPFHIMLNILRSCIIILPIRFAYKIIRYDRVEFGNIVITLIIVYIFFS